MKVEIVFAILCSLLFAAGSKPHKDRSYEKDLSDVEHHEDSDEHDPNYDHEAFLGKDEAKRFDELSPEESKERLGKIFDKIDTNKDGKVSETELKDWITKTSKRYLVEDRDRQWTELKLKDNEKLTWEDYKKHSFGDNTDDDDNTKNMIMRDEKRWNAADKDGDKMLSKEEFLDFIHPEEAPHMKSIVIEETMVDIDKDKDNKISLEEYIQDMWSPDEDEEKPDWVKEEEQSFKETRDKDKDGFLNFDEVADWIIPQDYDHVESETKHLFAQADVDNDSFLTKEEVLNKYDIFVGSQATDFGEALTRHEEL